MKYEKCFLASQQNERHFILCSDKTISIWKLQKTKLEQQQAFSLDQPIAYFDLIQKDQGDLLFLIVENLEWAILDQSLNILLEGKLQMQKSVKTIVGCTWAERNFNMLLSVKPGFLTYSILKLQNPLKISFSFLPINDDTHWASHGSEILSICPLRGTSTQDFASRQFFCVLIRYEDLCSLQFFSIDESGKELLPGPWSVQYLPPSTSEILSVHNSIIAFSKKTIFQFQLSNEKTINIEAEEVTSIMSYSDKCNRILCACKNKLMWLHVGPDNIKATMAATLPIQNPVSQLLSLPSNNAIVVLCFVKYAESIVILINLKTLTVGEICRWRENEFFPEAYSQHDNKTVITSKNRAKIIESKLEISPYMKIYPPGQRIFRLGEELFVLVGDSFSQVVKVEETNIKNITLKDFIVNTKTMLLYKNANQIVQITPNCINALGLVQVMFQDPISICCAVGSIILVSSYSTLYVYRDYELVKVTEMGNEILSICEKEKNAVIGVKDKGLFRIGLEKCEIQPYPAFFPLAGGYFYSFKDLDLLSTGSEVAVLYNSKVKKYQISIFRASFVKETVKYSEILLEGCDKKYLLTYPSLEIVEIDCFDLVSICSNLYLGLCAEYFCLGEAVLSHKSQILKTPNDIQALCYFSSGILVFHANLLTLYSFSHEEICKMSLKNLEKIVCCKVIDELLYISATTQGQNYLHMLHLKDFSIAKTLKTEDCAHKIEQSNGMIAVYYPYRVFIGSLGCEMVAEIKFQNAEYDELGKKLETDDIQRIIELKINENWQKIVMFTFVNTGRTSVERFERENKEFICVTNKVLYWGMIQNESFCVLTFARFESDCKHAEVVENVPYVLCDNGLDVYSLEILESSMLIMNPGYVDWRTYKIVTKSRHVVPETRFFHTISPKKFLLVSEAGFTSTLSLSN